MSLSKPVTSVAIMKLVEEGKLSLDDRVFGPGALLSIPFPASNKYVSQITVEHLLRHSAAPEWTNDANGPMFLQTQLSKKALVLWVLKNRTLKHAPGSRYAYSNFAYCILGLVIEKISGLSYENYVKQTILLPAKANSFTVASDKRGASPLEVTYYPHGDWDPYNLPLRRMDAHGGWIANAIDVVKFIQHTDAYPSPADLISAESIKTMTTPSPLNNNYAMGWNVNQSNNWWHTGELPGTAAILVRTNHGFNWAVLTNKTSDDKAFYAELDALTWKLLKEVKDSL
ncbi:MAG: beta-lactamase family protein [Gammaproteobacteria bacterium]|jgi:D-alanyl-D-alanine carboxypeptidase|nr:beta-lactamase family protein [Gammaproteobacteria bacterium]